MIAWRNLLDDIRIPWYDRGANTSRGHISIHCPWCGDSDPSHHLAINETSGEYRCYRAPSKHSGKSAPYLLIALGTARASIDSLMRAHGYSGAANTPTTPKRVGPVGWERFDPIGSYPPALEYLISRGFHNPGRVATNFDLRFARGGRYAQRLLLPYVWEGEVVGFTGRTWRADLEPRYLSFDPTEGALYIPRAPVPSDQFMLLVEGPLDALKGTVAVPQDVLLVSLTGADVTPRRLNLICAMARTLQAVFLCLDEDQYPGQTQRVAQSIRTAPFMRNTAVQRAKLPPRQKDLGGMQIGEIAGWIQKLTSQFGQGSSRTGLGLT